MLNQYMGYGNFIGLLVTSIKNEIHVAYTFSGKYPMSWARMLLNVNNPFVKWLNKVHEGCEQGTCNLNAQLLRVLRFIQGYMSGHDSKAINLLMLNNYLKGWKDIPDLPDELYPPEIEITGDMFVFLG